LHGANSRCQDEYQDKNEGHNVAMRAYTGAAGGCRSHGKWAVSEVPCDYMPGLTESKCRALCMEHATVLGGPSCKFVFFSPASGRGAPGVFEQDKCVLFSAAPAMTPTSLTSTKCNEMRCSSPAYCPVSHQFASVDRSSCCAGSSSCSDGVPCNAEVCATHPTATVPADCFCSTEHKPVHCGENGSFTNACRAQCALGTAANSCVGLGNPLVTTMAVGEEGSPTKPPLVSTKVKQ